MCLQNEILSSQPGVDSQEQPFHCGTRFRRSGLLYLAVGKSCDFSAARYRAADRALHNLLDVPFAVVHRILEIRKNPLSIHIRRADSGYEDYTDYNAKNYSPRR